MTPAGDLRPVVGVGAVVWRGSRLLLIRRGRAPLRGVWSLPGGRQGWGETVEAALRREVREETALELGPLTFVAVVDLLTPAAEGRPALHFTLLDYTAEALAGEAVAGDDAEAVAWFDMAEVARLDLWSETRAVIHRAAEVRASAGQPSAGS